MAEVKTEETTCSIPVGKSPDSGEDPTISDTKTAAINLEKKEPGTFRKAKRRKNCPSALEKSNTVCNSSFSFTFDTNSQTCLQFTPKFGSFNLVEPPAKTEGGLENIPVSRKKEEKEVLNSIENDDSQN